jgi:hypothetical protein
MKTINYKLLNASDRLKHYYKLIDDGSIDEFIVFAKKYNIFQPNGTKFYQSMCDKIKARLDREGLDYETVRPE